MADQRSHKDKPRMRFLGIGGSILPIDLPRGTSSLRCQQSIARYYGVLPQQVFFVSPEETGEDHQGDITAVICDSWKISCSECGARIECSCELEPFLCQCPPIWKNTWEATAEDTSCEDCITYVRLKDCWYENNADEFLLRHHADERSSPCTHSLRKKKNKVKTKSTQPAARGGLLNAEEQCLSPEDAVCFD